MPATTGQSAKKNNNPFALIQSKPDPWRGLVKGSTGLLKFETPALGMRAGFINLVNTYLRRGLKTPAEILPKYAPAGHGNNDPNAYIDAVRLISGLGRDEKITTKSQFIRLARAIVRIETGAPVVETEFKEGAELAKTQINAYFND
jgi:hypothetical protein